MVLSGEQACVMGCSCGAGSAAIYHATAVTGPLSCYDASAFLDPVVSPVMHATKPSTWPAVKQEAGAMLAIGVPIIVHNLALVGMGLTDAVMSGLLGAKTLAGVAVGSSVWAPVFLFSLGVLMAQSPTTAHLYGEGKLSHIGRRSEEMAWLSLVIGVLGLLLLRNAEPFLRAIHIEPEIVPVADGYLKAIAWG